MTETLDAPAANSQIEGSAAAFGALTPRVRLGNYCQIARKTGSVSKTQESVSKAGVASEYAHQLKKATTELARDMERSLWQGTKNAGASATTGRSSGGVFYWCSTNRKSMSNATGADLAGTAQAGAASTITVAAGTGASVTAGDHILITGGAGQGQYRVVASIATDVVTVTEAWDVVPGATSTYIVYTVPVALSETILNDGIQAARDAGGKPNAIYVSGKQKRAISGFAQGIRRVSDSGKKLTNSIDVYDSDFGPLAVKYDRWTPVGTAAIIDEGMFNTAFLRPVMAEELAKVGSSRDFMVEAEFTLEALGENANSLVLGAAL